MGLLRKIKRVVKKWNDAVSTVLRRVSIFRRLNTSFLLLILAASIFITFFSFYKYTDEIAENIDRYISMLVQNVGLKIQDTMQEYEAVALAFYDDSQVIRALRENAGLSSGGGPDTALYEQNRYCVESKLYQMRYNRKYIANIQFVSPSDQYYTVEPNGYRRGGTTRDAQSFYETDFYKVTKGKNGYPVWFDTAEQTKVFYKNEQSVYGIADIVTLGIAVYAPEDREFLGVLLLNIDLKAFSGAMEGYEAYNEGNAYLIGEDGVLMWFNPSITAPAFPRDGRLYQEMLKRGQDIEERNVEGRRVLLAYERIPDTQAFVTYIADLNVLYEGTHRIRNLCIIVLMVTVVACFVISYYVTRSISVPVGRLVKVMQKTGDGKWRERYDNSGHDEITILGERFNEMADKTDQLIEQVYLSEIRRQQISISWIHARLDALLMQINPHFLYNTLDIIRWEAMYEAGGESPVTRMIEKFSKLCRMGMRTGSNTITLREGMEHAKIYLEVINFRHKDKIQLSIDTQLDQESVYIPQFILQPIMENAVVHAFDDAGNGCRISIQAYIHGDTLWVSVRDNGRGMTQEELEKLKATMGRISPDRENIGLVNVDQRIRLFYGEKYGVRIASEQGKGTDVRVTLPVRHSSENMDKSEGGEGGNGIQGFDS